MSELLDQPWAIVVGVVVLAAVLLGRRLQLRGYGFGIEVGNGRDPPRPRPRKRR